MNFQLQTTLETRAGRLSSLLAGPESLLLVPYTRMQMVHCQLLRNILLEEVKHILISKNCRKNWAMKAEATVLCICSSYELNSDLTALLSLKDFMLKESKSVQGFC